MITPRRLFAVTLAFAAVLPGGCNRRSDEGPVVVSAIGATPMLRDAAIEPADMPGRVLADSVAQGLVRYDATGQIEPGLAERWTVIDDGMSYIFRLREAEWGDGERVTAADVVKVLRRQIAPPSRNPLAPYLTAIDDIVEMTPEVIEIRLKRPRPDLLKLFAQPELAIFRTHPPGGSGPYRIARNTAHGVLLRPAFDPARSVSDDIPEPGPEQNIDLIGERAARAVTRFAERQSDLVLGGSFVDWPLVPLAGIAPANFRVDPAAGLFGIAIAHRTGFLAEANNRAALAQAIDRDALVAAFAPGWSTAERILPEQLDSSAAPNAPAWTDMSATDRHNAARAQVANWQKQHVGRIELTLALPAGPGATILYGFVGAAFQSIGVRLRRVGEHEDADLRLVDAVAPYDSARWYLATACDPCGDDATAKLTAARDANSMSERAQAIADADAAIAADTPFIVIARPLRWSLVAIRLRAWQANVRAWHPLNHLRGDPN
jgi:peptide/nickel transport system substrate-binding protein